MSDADDCYGDVGVLSICGARNMLCVEDAPGQGGPQDPQLRSMCVGGLLGGPMRNSEADRRGERQRENETAKGEGIDKWMMFTVLKC